MNVKENEYLKGTWVKISDVQVEMPSNNGYSYMSADVHIPCGVTMIDMEECIKFIQDETIKKFADTFILNTASMAAKARMFPEHDAYYIGNICKHYKGSEIISRIKEYEKKQQAKLDAERRKKIEEARDLLEKEGYIVSEDKEKKR